MRLKCVNNKVLVTNGHYDPRVPNLIEDKSISLDKVYQCEIVPIVGGQAKVGSGIISTDVQFLVFNDNKQWRLYDTHMFALLEAE